jgi:hypothetical protein
VVDDRDYPTRRPQEVLGVDSLSSVDGARAWRAPCELPSGVVRHQLGDGVGAGLTLDELGLLLELDNPY